MDDRIRFLPSYSLNSRPRLLGKNVAFWEQDLKKPLSLYGHVYWGEGVKGPGEYSADRIKIAVVPYSTSEHSSILTPLGRCNALPNLFTQDGFRQPKQQAGRQQTKIQSNGNFTFIKSRSWESFIHPSENEGKRCPRDSSPDWPPAF